MTIVIVVIGAGLIGQAIARRVGAEKHVMLGDLSQEHSDAAAKVLSDAGFETTPVDALRESVHPLVQTATALGNVSGIIHAAGVSPSQAPPATILAVDLYGTARACSRSSAMSSRGAALAFHLVDVRAPRST